MIGQKVATSDKIYRNSCTKVGPNQFTRLLLLHTTQNTIYWIKKSRKQYSCSVYCNRYEWKNISQIHYRRSCFIQKTVQVSPESAERHKTKTTAQTSIYSSSTMPVPQWRRQWLVRLESRVTTWKASSRVIPLESLMHGVKSTAMVADEVDHVGKVATMFRSICYTIIYRSVPKEAWS